MPYRLATSQYHAPELGHTWYYSIDLQKNQYLFYFLPGGFWIGGFDGGGGWDIFGTAEVAQKAAAAAETAVAAAEEADDATV